MSVEVQIRRGAAASIAANTPAQGEIWFNETTQQLTVGDGSTSGGWAHALSTRTAVADAAYAAKLTDRIVAFTALTAPRAVTLPAASGFPGGAVLTVIDESGNCSPSKALSVAPAGADTINGLNAALPLASAYASLALESNGVSGWAVVCEPGLVAPSPKGATAALQWIESLVTCSGATTPISLGTTATIYAVALRVTTTVTGCTSIQINESGMSYSNTHWGSNIGVSAGTTNQGLAAPETYYNGSSTLALAAVGGGASFTGGTVRVSVLALTVTPPTS